MAKLLSDRTAEWLRGEMRGGNDMRSRRRITRWTPQESTGPVYQPFQLEIRDTGEVDEHDEPIYAVFVRGRQSITIVGVDEVLLSLTGETIPANIDEWLQIFEGIPEATTVFSLYVWLAGNTGQKAFAWVAAGPPQEYTNANVRLAEIVIGAFNATTGKVTNNITGNVFVARYYGDADETTETVQKTISVGLLAANRGRVSLAPQATTPFSSLDANSDSLLFMHRGLVPELRKLENVGVSTLTVVTDVDFANETVTKKQIRFIGFVNNA